MIKAVIFDCFGVLAAEGWLPFKDAYFGHDKALFDQATDLTKQMDLGFIDYDQFIDEVAKLAIVSPSEARRAIDENPPNTPLFDYIKEELKPKFKIGILSNAGADWLDELFTKEQLKLFDAVALSYDIGHLKPDPEAYQIIAERLGVEVNECIFVDDQQRAVDGATAAGMPAVLYTSTTELKKILNQMLTNPNY